MQVDFTINAESRGDVGKGASRRLRHTNKVPGIIYGAGQDAVLLAVDHNDLMNHLAHEAFYSHILTVKVDGKAEKAVLKDLQRHPAKPRLLHVDFLRVGENDIIHMHIPLHFTGQDVAPGVKAGGQVTHSMTAVDIACKGKDLPEYLTVDLSAMELNSILHLSDIALPKGVQIPALALGADHNLPVASIHMPRGAAEEAAPAAAAGTKPAE
jgi:large subunit ribosomal protein L25